MSVERGMRERKKGKKTDGREEGKRERKERVCVCSLSSYISFETGKKMKNGRDNQVFIKVTHIRLFRAEERGDGEREGRESVFNLSSYL